MELFNKMASKIPKLKNQSGKNETSPSSPRLEAEKKKFLHEISKNEKLKASINSKNHLLESQQEFDALSCMVVDKVFERIKSGPPPSPKNEMRMSNKQQYYSLQQEKNFVSELKVVYGKSFQQSVLENIYTSF